MVNVNLDLRCRNCGIQPIELFCIFCKEVIEVCECIKHNCVRLRIHRALIDERIRKLREEPGG